MRLPSRTSSTIRVTLLARLQGWLSLRHSRWSSQPHSHNYNNSQYFQECLHFLESGMSAAPQQLNIPASTLSYRKRKDNETFMGQPTKRYKPQQGPTKRSKCKKGAWTGPQAAFWKLVLSRNFKRNARKVERVTQKKI